MEVYGPACAKRTWEGRITLGEALSCRFEES